MNNDIANTINKLNGKAVAGVILLAIGSILLIRQFDFFFLPDWLFSWPMFVIAWGLYIGARHNFRNATWAFTVLVGLAFLIDDNIANADRVIWPVAIMAFGAWIALRPGKKTGGDIFNNDDKAKQHFNFDKTEEKE